VTLKGFQYPRYKKHEGVEATKYYFLIGACKLKITNEKFLKVHDSINVKMCMEIIHNVKMCMEIIHIC
jgi:hypothetical protein